MIFGYFQNWRNSCGKLYIFHKLGHPLVLWPDIRPNLPKHFRNWSNVGSGALRSTVAILKEKLCEEQYLYICTTGVILTCFCNFYLSTEQIAVNLEIYTPNVEFNAPSTPLLRCTLGYIRLHFFPIWRSVPSRFFFFFECPLYIHWLLNSLFLIKQLMFLNIKCSSKFRRLRNLPLPRGSCFHWLRQVLLLHMWKNFPLALQLLQYPNCRLFHTNNCLL